MSKQISVLPSYMPIREARSLEAFEEENPDRKGRWIRNDPDRLRFLESKLNYRLERDGKAGTGDKMKGAITSGNDILVSCPREEYELREKLRASAAARQLDGPRETFKTEGRKRGVETEDKTKRYEGTMTETFGEKDKED